MSTYANIDIFGFERMVSSDGYPETIVPELLGILKEIKKRMKANKLNVEDAACLVLRNNDTFFEGYNDRHDYTYTVNDFKNIFINGKEFTVKRLHKFTEKDYEKLKDKLREEVKDDDNNVDYIN